MPGTIIDPERAVIDPLKMLRLMRLCSPMLPIGSFTWSQGLESAVERGWIHHLESAGDWVEAGLLKNVARMEGPLLIRLLGALQAGDQETFVEWNELTFALRETSELYNEDSEQGELLQRLNRLHYPSYRHQSIKLSLPAAFAEALHAAEIPANDGLLGFLWMWVETQVSQLIKLIPLGLRDGQQLLDRLLAKIPLAHHISLSCPDDEIGVGLPGRSMASSFHESQYCRIYRS